MTSSSGRSWPPMARTRRTEVRPVFSSIAKPTRTWWRRNVGRLFLGMDLQCCQCHDHPLIDGYHQQQYYGLYAFLSRTVLVGGKGPDGAIKPGSVAVLGEKAEGDVTYSSVFKKKVSHKTGPRVLEGQRPAEPAVPKGRNTWFLPARITPSPPSPPSAG